MSKKKQQTRDDLRLEACPQCGLTGYLEDTGEHIHCLDCGHAFPKSQPKSK